MKTLLVPFLLLAATSDDVAGPREAVRVYYCDFEAEADKNYDRWPDGWTRRRGRGFPAYLPIEIQPDASPGRPTARQCLRIELDGGAGLAYSPPIEINSLFSYVLHAYVRTKGLNHDRAFCAVTFLDAEGKRLRTFQSIKLQHTSDWTKVAIGPVTPQSDQARWAVIELRLQPGDAVDLVGSASFDDLWFGRLPRVSISTNSESNVFTEPEAVEVTCRVSGISDAEPELLFELIDVEDRVLHREQRPVQTDVAATVTRSSALHSLTPGLPAQQTSAYSATASWKPPIPGNGFYKVRASMPNHTGLIIERVVKLAVVDPQPKLVRGEFGWTLPEGDQPLSLRALAGLLGEMGIHWVKFPVWYSDHDGSRADRLAQFTERLSAHHIQLIGLLDDPPQDVKSVFGEENHLPVASIFVEPEIWHPAVDPVMTRLSLKVRWWQLGGDRDTSFVNFPDLENKLQEIRHDLNRFGQEINLGIAWRSIDEPPQSKSPPWSFLSYTADPPLTAQELRSYFSPEEPGTAQRWLLLDPLPSSHYDLHTRAKDLVLRMLAAKMQGIEGVFIPDPFDAERGLMEPDGSPAEILLAWRTTAVMISGATHLGSLQLPNGSQNHVFVRGDEAIMMVWNDVPTEEKLYLGEKVKQIDLWGRTSSLATIREAEFTRQVIPVGPLPTFLTGVNPTIARWRMAFDFETKRLASVFGQEQVAFFHFRNAFEQGIGGSVSLHTPIISETLSTATKFKLAIGERQREKVRIVLGANVNSGPQPIRADFTITADRTYRFSVFRTVQVGLGDIQVEMSSHLDDRGNLVVQQQLLNMTDHFVSFNCMLFAEGRRRQRRQIYNLGRGRSTNVFVFPHGEELIGSSLWLRAEEIGGARVLNHRGLAER